MKGDVMGVVGGREMEKMRANVFRGINNFHIEEVEKPHAGVGEAVIRVTLTTICGTDLHIVRGEYSSSIGANPPNQCHPRSI